VPALVLAKHRHSDGHEWRLSWGTVLGAWRHFDIDHADGRPSGPLLGMVGGLLLVLGARLSVALRIKSRRMNVRTADPADGRQRRRCEIGQPGRAGVICNPGASPARA
jgi:hypothetical protein